MHKEHLSENGPISTFGLDRHGIKNVAQAYWNQSTASLFEHALRKEQAQLLSDGPLVVMTGKHTGRAARDKYVVEEPRSKEHVDWGAVNKPMSQERYEALRKKVLAYYQGRELYVQDLLAGADPRYSLKVRVVTESAPHAHFARTMFRIPKDEDLGNHEPGFTVLHAPFLLADPDKDGTRSETFIVLNLGENEVLIGGTRYAGEIKKSVFSALNYYLPRRGVLSMHASANIGREGPSAGKSAVFFGLSGTGKTTLSADPERLLIGDDEHGWCDDGIFNFEGGCYAKVINLSPEHEPDIHRAVHTFGAMLENVAFDARTREVDFYDDNITENTRGAYPIAFIPNHAPEGKGGHPTDVVMLTADAFGVLPPISRLNENQAAYWFLSGYTAKVAGTEEGVTEPTATFSACFGAPFMPCHPTVYAEMLADRIRDHKVRVWLINTGWTGGPYGIGNRMSLPHTRAMLRAALDGELDNVSTRQDPVFGLEVPTSCPTVPSEILDPRATWEDGAAYDKKAKELASLFHKNFESMKDRVKEEIAAAGPNGV
jgi:phosphoenolpyruvate carboxykinase (ATP)